MKPLILVAGYTRTQNVEKLFKLFPEGDTLVGCTYHRQPTSDIKKAYLQKFDVVFDLNNSVDVDKLKSEDNVLCVTCTQERDMSAYIQTLLLCKKITKEQADAYELVINKHTFKESIQISAPHLVPKHHLITNDSLEDIATLTYPQVIKPTGLAGSAMIKIVHSPEELLSHYNEFRHYIQDIGSKHFNKKIEIVSEEYITGPQYSVNTYINRFGETTLCPIIRIITPQEFNSGDTYSALQYTTNELSVSAVLALTEAIQKIVDHFCIQNTSAHFDMVLHETGWKCFEVGLRIGGFRQDIYQYSFKMDHFKNDILNRLGKQVVIPQQKKVTCVVQKAADEVGVLQKISYERSIDTSEVNLVHESKIRKIGEKVAPVSGGGATLTRHFVVGKNEDSVLRDSHTLYNSIQFDLETR